MPIILFLEGLLILFLNKIRYSIFGYNKPRDFSSQDIEQAIRYDKQVVNGWIKYLKKYAPDYDLKDKKVLELGPGNDLGTGMILLSHKIDSYKALDANDLA